MKRLIFLVSMLSLNVYISSIYTQPRLQSVDDELIAFFITHLELAQRRPVLMKASQIDDANAKITQQDQSHMHQDLAREEKLRRKKKRKKFLKAFLTSCAGALMGVITERLSEGVEKFMHEELPKIIDKLLHSQLEARTTAYDKQKLADECKRVLDVWHGLYTQGKVAIISKEAMPHVYMYTQLADRDAKMSWVKALIQEEKEYACMCELVLSMWEYFPADMKTLLTQTFHQEPAQ